MFKFNILLGFCIIQISSTLSDVWKNWKTEWYSSFCFWKTKCNNRIYFKYFLRKNISTYLYSASYRFWILFGGILILIIMSQEKTIFSDKIHISHWRFNWCYDNVTHASKQIIYWHLRPCLTCSCYIVICRSFAYYRVDSRDL